MHSPRWSTSSRFPERTRVRARRSQRDEFAPGGACDQRGVGPVTTGSAALRLHAVKLAS